MNLIGSRLGDPVDHTIGSAAIFGGVRRTLNFELLHTLDAHAVHGRVVPALAVGFGAVQLFALAIQQPTADARVAAGSNHTWRQNHESQVCSDSATDKQGEILDRIFRDDFPEVGSLQVQKRRGDCHFHRLVHPANRQGHVHVGNCCYMHFHTRCFGFPESRLFRSDCVVASGQVEKVVDPAVAGSCGLRQTCIHILKCDRRIRHGCSRRVRHDSPDRTAILSENGTGNHQTNNEKSASIEHQLTFLYRRGWIFTLEVVAVVPNFNLVSSHITLF